MSTDPTSSGPRNGAGSEAAPPGDDGTDASADRAVGGAAGGEADDGPGVGAEVRDDARPASDPVSPLDFDAYQERALETAVFPEIGGERAVYPALGLADEAGEVLGKIKKLYRDRGGEVTPRFRRQLKKELGDVYWYLAVLADAFDLRSSDVAEANLRKLADRAERGVIRGEGDDR